MSLLESDPYCPTYHIRAPEGALNDPCGFLWRNGQYHVLYQWEARWAHVASRDLVHWRHLPVALTATPGSSDEGGCWSGHAVENDGTPAIIYTGVDIPTRQWPREWRQVVCLATGSDDMVSWKKSPANPVIDAPPAGMDVTGFRDPCVWREGDDWYMILGSGIRDQGGTALMYRSPDLVHWEYLHPFCTDTPDVTNRYWECPDFFSLGDQYVLLMSKMSPLLFHASTDSCRALMSTFYSVGQYRDHRFTPDTAGNLDAGGHFYAAKTMLDGQGRRLLWGWVWEARSREVWQKADWSGVLSLPRVLTLGSNGKIQYHPPKELESLRGRHWEAADVTLEDSVPAPLDPVSGDCLELIAELAPGGAAECGLTVRRSVDGSEQTRLVYRQSDTTLSVDRSQSSLDPQPFKILHGGRLELAPGENLKLHVFLDRSVIEVFANGQLCLTSRIYPTQDDSLGTSAFATGGRGTLVHLDAWTMAAAPMEGVPL